MQCSWSKIGYRWKYWTQRGFYSSQDTKTPMINATISVTMNIVLNVILSKFMCIGGLALATSISAYIRSQPYYRFCDQSDIVA